MGLARRVKCAVGMTMVFTMNMRMRVGYPVMDVLMCVTLGHVQPYTDGH